MKIYTFNLVGKAKRLVNVKAKNEKEAIKFMDELIHRTSVADFTCHEINELEVSIVDEELTEDDGEFCCECPICCMED